MPDINEIQLLNYMRQNVEMGIDGIEMVENGVKNVAFRDELAAERREYTKLLNETDSLIRRKNGTPEDLPVMAKMSASVVGTMKKMGERPDSSVAEDMMKGTSTGITKLTKHLHEYRGQEQDVLDLADRILKYEEQSLQKIKPFL